MSGIITISDIHVYAFHGCLTEEAIIGGNYIVDVKINTDYSLGANTDNLTQTVDYTTVFEIVKREMNIRSKLIEHAAQRICKSLKNEIPGIDKVEVTLTKIAPPVNGMLGRVSVVATS